MKSDIEVPAVLLSKLKNRILFLSRKKSPVLWHEVMRIISEWLNESSEYCNSKGRKVVGLSLFRWSLKLAFVQRFMLGVEYRLVNPNEKRSLRKLRRSIAASPFRKKKITPLAVQEQVDRQHFSSQDALVRAGRASFPTAEESQREANTVSLVDKNGKIRL